MEMFKTLTSVLLAGNNTIEFTDSNITDASILDCYLTDSDLIIEESSQTGTTVSITVSNHTEPVGVALFINNCDTFKPYDDTDVQNELLQLGTRVNLLESSMNNKQDKLTAGENITIENNVISATGGSGGGGIDYSTTEQDTGKKWIDGRTVYQRTFYKTNIATTAVEVDSTIGNGLTVIHMYGSCGGWLPLNANLGGNYWNNCYYGDNRRIMANIGSLIEVGNSILVTVEYCKP